MGDHNDDEVDVVEEFIERMILSRGDVFEHARVVDFERGRESAPLQFEEL